MVGDWREFVRSPKQADFGAKTVDVARALIGAVLVHDVNGTSTVGRIVETEAYLAEGDPASHSYRGPTSRNASMFGAPGRAYVYLCYGVHECFNVVTGPPRVGEAVLVRALEPLAGLAAMRSRRGGNVDERTLCAGPGRLTRALSIGLEHDGCDLSHGPLRVYFPRRPVDDDVVSVGPRIGITKAVELPLRFALTASPWVSRRVRSDRSRDPSVTPSAE